MLDLVTDNINTARNHCIERSKESHVFGTNCVLSLEEMKLNVPSEPGIHGIFEEYYEGKLAQLFKEGNL